MSNIEVESILKDYGLSEEEVYGYLEELRESGETNMFGASPYLQDEFGFDRREARIVLLDWMNNYNK